MKLLSLLMARRTKSMSQVSPAKIEYPTRNAVSVTENNGIDGFLPFSEGFHFKLVATFNPIFRDVSPQLL
ncbi:MAG: hypothetical protein QW789_05605 [Nitrososphaerota archaeon]